MRFTTDNYIIETNHIINNCKDLIRNRFYIRVTTDGLIRGFIIDGDVDYESELPWGISENEYIKVPDIKLYEFKNNKLTQYSSSAGSECGPDAIKYNFDDGYENNFDRSKWLLLETHYPKNKKLTFNQLSQLYAAASKACGGIY